MRRGIGAAGATMSPPAGSSPQRREGLDRGPRPSATAALPERQDPAAAAGRVGPSRPSRRASAGAGSTAAVATR